MAKSMEEIAELLQNTRFRKALFGLSEEDVWTKLEHLQSEYRELFIEERNRSQALLDERDDYIDQQAQYIKQLENQTLRRSRNYGSGGDQYG